MSTSSPPSSSSLTPNVKPDISSHLSYPSPEQPAPSTSTSYEERSRPLLKERLYVGNLHPSVDEYTLLQVFTKFGKVSKLDYLFHKTGPLKGKPRGYAFVEFAHPNDAQRALERAHDKLLRGRKLVITHAHQAPLDQGGHYKPRRIMNEAGKPTTLSLLKSASTGRANLTEGKIARMEAKLRELEQSSVESPVPAAHPSLPSKPSAATVAAAAPAPPASQRQSVPPRRHQAPLPSLPLTKPAPSQVALASQSHLPRSVPSKRGATLAGVRIVKKKVQ
ncbi:hypothetical protein FOMPIDRAFT_1163924 [Fomitopsis schrenkii]|uniref:Probable RNA-binding protein 18 n=1 Tax=Fomitopsis schrenkii TaxID=2126942 RepID=S8FD52_FOMSC|nr:hypothetical protein FOMPIDRAFT_1163924 [Fomitopsis schrenkii]